MDLEDFKDFIKIDFKQLMFAYRQVPTFTQNLLNSPALPVTIMIGLIFTLLLTGLLLICQSVHFLCRERQIHDTEAYFPTASPCEDSVFLPKYPINSTNPNKD